MAISYIGTGTSTGTTNIVLGIPAGVQAGDLLLAVITSNAVETAPTGWTRIVATGSPTFISVFTKYATASETSVTFSGTGSLTRGTMSAYRGSGAYQIIPTVTTGSSTTITTPTLTTTYTNDYVVSIFARTNGVSTLSNPAGINTRYNVSSTSTTYGLVVADELQASAGVSTARDSTLSLTGAWTGLQLAFIETRTVYWVGGAGTWNASTTTNWADASNGAGGKIAPTPWDNIVIDSSSGTGTITCTAGLCQNLTVTATQAIVLGAVSSTLSIYGNFSLPAGGSFSVGGNNNTIFTFAATTTGKTLTFNGKNMWGVTFNGIGGGWIFQDNFVANNLGQFRITAGAVNTNGKTITGSFLTVAATSTASLTLGASVCVFGQSINISATNFTIIPGTSSMQFTISNETITLGTGLTYYTVIISSAVAQATAVAGSNTYTNLTINRTTASISDNTKIVSFNGNQTVTGTFTVTGPNTNQRVFICSSVSGTPRTFTVTSAALTNCDFQDITASTTITGTSIGNVGGNTNITPSTPKSVYWNSASASNWYGNGWATTSTGTPNIVNFPLPQDTAYITNAGAGTSLSLQAGSSTYLIGNIDMSGRTSAFTIGISEISNPNSIFVGSWINGSGTAFSGTNALTFSGRGSYVITCAGKTFPGAITINALGGTYTLNDDFATGNTRTLTLTNGTFDANSKNVSIGQIALGVGTKSLIMGTGTWTLGGTGIVWNLTGNTPGLTFSGASAPIILSDTSTTTREFRSNTYTYNKLTIGGTTGISQTAISGGGGCSFTEIASTKTVAHTISFGGNATTIIGTWSVTGTAGNVVTVNSSSAGVIATLTITNKTTSVNYLSIKDINSTNVAPVTFFAGSNSTNTSNNRGVAFASGATTAAYILTSGTSFTTPADWNNSANNIYLIGGGGGGSGSNATASNRAGGGGGGGGGFRLLSNQTISGAVSYAIGAGGTAGAAGNGTLVTAGTGGTTTWNTSNTATGGTGGSALATGTPASTGGVGGTGTYTGGTGGAGGINTASLATGGGGGGGAAGVNGAGGNGGIGATNQTQVTDSGGGGGGNGGGTAGGNGTYISGTFGISGAGGNNSLGSGGGASVTDTSGLAGVRGGGGSGGAYAVNAFGGNGGAGADILGGVGSGGGSGGASHSINNTSAVPGLYGAGGGGSGASTITLTWTGAAGAQGAIIIVYAVGGGQVSNFFFLF